jgi:hypothetical protein
LVGLIRVEVRDSIAILLVKVYQIPNIESQLHESKNCSEQVESAQFWSNRGDVIAMKSIGTSGENRIAFVVCLDDSLRKLG